MTTQLDSETLSAEAPAPPGAPTRRLSALADSLQGSEILRIAAEVREKRDQGAAISDFTIGDFGADQFPSPALLVQGTADALLRGETKYPPSTGLPVLRKAVATFYKRDLGLDY